MTAVKSYVLVSFLTVAACHSAGGVEWSVHGGQMGVGSSVHVVDGEVELWLVGLTGLRIGIAFVQRGALYGAADRHRLTGERRAWLDFEGEYVDHPSLGRYRATLAMLQESPSRSAGEFAAAGRDLPFETLTGGLARRFVDDDPERAADLLDAATGLALDDDDARALLILALRARPEDQRVARWLDLDALHDDDGALCAVAAWPGCGPLAAHALLRQLSDVRSARREEVLVAASERLLAEPGADLAIERALAELPSTGRGRAIAGLLARDAVPASWVTQILRQLDDLLRDSDACDVLLQVVGGPHFQGDVQDAVLRAARDLARASRRRVLASMQEEPRLTPRLTPVVASLLRD